MEQSTVENLSRECIIVCHYGSWPWANYFVRHKARTRTHVKHSVLVIVFLVENVTTISALSFPLIVPPARQPLVYPSYTCAAMTYLHHY